MKNTIPKNSDPVLLRIIKLLNEQGKTDKEFNEGIGLANGTLYQWKNGHNRTAHYLYIKPICEYLQTTPNYLFYGMDKIDINKELTSQENELIQMYRNADSEKQDCIIQVMRLFNK